MDDYEANVERFTGFADLYDRYRYRPPAALREMLLRFAGVERPDLVVDLGCGTGISTRFWADHALKVIGVDPAADMRERAAAATTAENVEYLRGFGHDAPVPGGAADIVTCAQSLHWMDPGRTFREVVRVLRPGGVFAAYDYRAQAPTGIVELDLAVEAAIERVMRLEIEHDLKKDVRFHGKDRHEARMRDSGLFALVRQLYVGNVEATSAEGILGGVGSLGALQTLRKMGLSDDETGMAELEEVARRCLGDREVPAHVSYLVNVGITPDRRAESPTTQST